MSVINTKAHTRTVPRTEANNDSDDNLPSWRERFPGVNNMHRCIIYIYVSLYEIPQRLCVCNNDSE